MKCEIKIILPHLILNSIKLDHTLLQVRAIFTYTTADVSSVMPAQRDLVVHWLQDERAAKQVAKITLPVLVLNGGHAMIFQYPSELAQVINEFIEASANR